MERIKKENETSEDESRVLDSSDLRDIFETESEKLFRCNVCLKTYAKVTSYEAHLKIHNNTETQTMCHVCGAIFTCLQELKTHVTSHNKRNRRYPCEICGRVFFSLSARKRHKLVHLITPEWSCELCPRRFKQHSFYINHLYMHKLREDQVSHSCPLCRRSFTSKDALSSHDCKLKFKNANSERETVIRTLPEFITVKLENEDINVEMESVLSNDVHMENEAIKVEEEAFSERVIYSDVPDDYTVIEIPSHSKGEFMCGECGKEYNDLSELSLHLDKHNSTDKYECMDCDEVFSFKYSLLQHIRGTHSTPQPCTCDICGAEFVTKAGLKNHSVVHTSLGYPCDECNNAFKGRSGLYLHKQRVHRGRKDFACEVCGKRFALKCQRENHHRIHTGEKPYKCETCGVGFRAPSGLYAHRKTHTDERPYECEICGKHLRLPYNLRLHMRTHTGEKPYVCEICGRAFAQSGDCKKHKNTHKKGQQMDNFQVEDKTKITRITSLPVE